MLTSFFLSNAPLPTPNRWLHCLSSSKLSLAGDENDGSYIQHCSFCCRVVVELVFVLVLMLVVALVSVLLFY